MADNDETKLNLKSAFIRRETTSPTLGRFSLVGISHFQVKLGTEVSQEGSVQALRGPRAVCAD